MASGERRASADRTAAGGGVAWRLHRWAGTGRWAPAAMVGVLLVAILAACGGDDDDDAPTATAPVAVTATAPSAETGPGPEGSPIAGEPTVGDIAARIATAWSGVTTYRANEVTFPLGDPAVSLVVASPIASPVASPVMPADASPAGSPAVGPTTADVRAIDEVVLPDRKHRRIVRGDEVLSEIVFADGQIYARGEFVHQYVDPALPLETWVQLDIRAVSTATEVGQTLIGFASTVGAPLSGLPPEQLELPARPIGQTVVDGRTCDVYQVVRTTATGERVDVAIGIDATGLPCLVETRAGGLVILATYVAFNEPIEIAAPAAFEARAPREAATPGATPEPAPGG